MRVQAFVCGTLSGLVPQGLFSLFPSFLRRFFLAAELWLWKKMNGLDHLDFHSKPADALVKKPLIVFSWKNCDDGAFQTRLERMRLFPRVVVNLSHYFVNTARKAAIICQIPDVILWGESDITANPYFRRFFAWYERPVMVVPFCVQDRFRPPEQEGARTRKLIATGSFHFLPDEKPRRLYDDFMRFFGATNYHYIRNDLYQSKDAEAVARVADVLCSPYRERKKISGWLQRFVGAGQKKYFSLNIVEAYQKYVFATVGEERSGSPGIGTFEAMACGAIPLIEPSCYVGLGMEDGRNCLTYRGDVGSLLRVLDGAPHGHELVAIQEAAKAYVATQCRGASVWDAFVRKACEGDRQ